MPSVSSRTHRAEAKYNVTLDFPNLGLHSAAASGNLGLVTYALEHGQPVNSVLDGVLPLHVACSGGNDLIVRLLIDRGADVNAPRLPRKYSSDRHRDTSAPIVGSSGATPLHFAAANGHEHVVLTLLLHGAPPDRADKHSVTPEMLARQNGWTRCADLLRQWTREKDRDLRERETLAPELDTAARNEDGKPLDKKLKVKRSIDNALNMIRPSLPTPPSSAQIQEDASYSTSSPPMHIHASASLAPSPDAYTAEDFPPRRPSLPHIFDVPPHAQGQEHTHSQSSSTHHHHGKSSGRPSFSSSRRPRSAGTGTVAPDPGTASTSSTPGRLRGKISLLHMFKKSAGDSATSSPGAPTTPDSRDSLSGYASSSSLVTSASASPAPERERERSRGPSATSPLRTRASESGPLSSAASAASSQPYTATLTTVPSSRSRLGSESHSQPGGADAASFPPLAVELHQKLSVERCRTRSGSGSSTNPAEPQNQPPAKAHSSSPQPSNLVPQVQGQLQGHRSPPTRPGILRPHGRSASSGQSQFQPPALLGERSLRFDSSSGAVLSTKRSGLGLGLGLDLKGSGSVSSLRGENHSGSGSPRSPRSASSQSQQRLRDQDSSDTLARRRQATVADDEDDEGYGEVISPRIGVGMGLEGKSRLRELRSESSHPLQRRPSAGSQLSRHSSTASTLPSPTAAAAGAPEEKDGAEGFDCPFSINRPPLQPLPPDEQQAQSATTTTDSRSLLAIHPVDNRGRGDSFGSSMSTSTDASMPQTPGPTPTHSLGLGLGLQIRSPDATSLDLPLDGELEDREREKPRARAGMGPGYVSTRVRAPPLDIDIRAISSHAQAEALVQRAQKSILDPEDVDIEVPGFGLLNGSAGPGSGMGMGGGGAAAGGTTSAGTGTGTGTGSGRTPLSAKLAAYGESLAIERRFKQREEQKRERGARGGGNGSPQSADTPVGSPRTPNQNHSRSREQLRSMRSESGVRTFSLEDRPMLAPAHTPRRTKQRRPHTADGETSDHTGGFLSPGRRQLSPGHKPSLSGSAIGTPPTSEPAYARTPASSRTLPIISSGSPSPTELPPRIVRSRTPDPGAHAHHLHAYDVDVDVDMDVPSPVEPAGFGVPLSRVATAPPRHASPDIVTQRSVSEQERERARANKLMKMGLLAHDSFPRAHSPYGHARNGGGSGGAGGVGGAGAGAGAGVGGAVGGSRQRFGGIRGFVQTLTGKT